MTVKNKARKREVNDAVDLCAAGGRTVGGKF